MQEHPRRTVNDTLIVVVPGTQREIREVKSVRKEKWMFHGNAFGLYIRFEVSKHPCP